MQLMFEHELCHFVLWDRSIGLFAEIELQMILVSCATAVLCRAMSLSAVSVNVVFFLLALSLFVLVAWCYW